MLCDIIIDTEPQHFFWAATSSPIMRCTQLRRRRISNDRRQSRTLDESYSVYALTSACCNGQKPRAFGLHDRNTHHQRIRRYHTSTL